MKRCKICKKREVYERGVCRSCLNGFRTKYKKDDKLDDALDRFNNRKP